MEGEDRLFVHDSAEIIVDLVLEDSMLSELVS